MSSGDLSVCESCKFWVPLTKALGQCRRHSPVLIEDRQAIPRYRADFPETSPGDWCGDFEVVVKELGDKTFWHPIETAPKDGKLILVRERCGRVQVAKWCCPDGRVFDWYVQLNRSGTDRYPTWDVVQWAEIPE